MNARTLLDVAAMFGVELMLHAPRFAATSLNKQASEPPITGLDSSALARLSPLLALDNLDRAEPLFGYRVPPSSHPGLVDGNERHGISRRLAARADRVLEIPMGGRGVVNCLNVAAAAAVGLHYLSRGGIPAQQISSHPEQRRPHVLLLGARDHFELGSSIRSAGAFGWRNLLIDDRYDVWFDVDRATRAEGRAAARRARNPIHLRRVREGTELPYDEAVVVTASANGVPLERTKLARGGRQLLVLADERGVGLQMKALSWLARRVQLASLELPAPDHGYRFHLAATIALAETARQVGRPARSAAPRFRGLRYDSLLGVTAPPPDDVVDLEELAAY